MAYVKEMGRKNMRYWGIYLVTTLFHDFEDGIDRVTGERARYYRTYFRFEWIQKQGEPWWIEKGIGEDFDSNDMSPFIPSSTIGANLAVGIPASCRMCHRISDTIFEVSGSPTWICLHGDCPSAQDQLTTQKRPWLTYSHSFLVSKFAYTRDTVPYALKPLSDFALNNKDQICRGVYCHECGRLSSREQWTRWTCSNESCSNSVSCIPEPAILEDLIRSHKPDRNEHDQSIPFCESHTPRATIRQYDMEGDA
ncbi:hypothetical protein BT69DRAFT_1349433, partial [Atractiella rhizophila]